MLSAKVTITGIDDVKARLDKLGRKLYIFDAAMNSIGRDLVTYYSGPAFDSQGGGFAGGRWQPLQHTYALFKAKKYGTPIMVGGGTSDHMRDSFTYSSDSTSVTIGNTKPYFVYHQSTEEPRTRLPRRQMLGVNETVKGIIRDIVEKDIRDKLDDM